jgi:hypothetical protein
LTGDRLNRPGLDPTDNPARQYLDRVLEMRKSPLPGG